VTQLLTATWIHCRSIYLDLTEFNVSSSGSREDSLSLFFTRGSGPDTNGKQSVSLQTCHSLRSSICFYFVVREHTASTDFTEREREREREWFHKRIHNADVSSNLLYKTSDILSPSITN
jgi:hypothetical protein